MDCNSLYHEEYPSWIWNTAATEHLLSDEQMGQVKQLKKPINNLIMASQMLKMSNVPCPKVVLNIATNRLN